MHRNTHGEITMGTQKEHRAPVRYSLKPEENKEILTHCQSHGHMTDRQMKSFASRFGCSQKTIHEAISRRGFDIVAANLPQSRGRSRAVEEARQRAEAHFTTPANKYPPKEVRSEEEKASEKKLDILAEEEMNLRRAFEKREAEMLEAVADLERQLAEQTAKAEEQQERAMAAMQQTRRLRIATRADRETLEEVKGNVTSLQVKCMRLEKQAEKIAQANTEIKNLLKESMARERRLLDALSKSEYDLRQERAKHDA
jgi:chromosome segregation ATPase